MNSKRPCVYFLASGRNGWIYIGVTSNLQRRATEHREGTTPGWAWEKGAVHLVRFEFYDTMDEAIVREKRLKKYHRSWKKQLIERDNPEWNDLYETLWT